MSTATLRPLPPSLRTIGDARPALPTPGALLFSAMEGTAARLGWPQAFTDDLQVHDRALMLSPEAPRDLLWMIRPTGTDLYDMRSGPRWYQASIVLANAERNHGTEMRWFHGSDRGLEPIEPHQAMMRTRALWTTERTFVPRIRTGDVIEHGGRTSWVTGRAAGQGFDCLTVRRMQDVGMQEPGVPTTTEILWGAQIGRLQPRG